MLSFLFKYETRFKTKEFIYVVPENFDPITKFLMKLNIYEKKERTLLKLMKNDTDIIEAGAGIGLISMYLKRKIKFNRLIMIEPNKKMNEIIKKNFLINNFHNSDIHILNYGLSDSERENVTFHKFESDMANTISQDTLDYNLKIKEADQIDTISIDKIIEKYNIKKFQLVLDIEGEELNVLRNNNKWMDNCSSILLENHLPKVKLNKLNQYVVSKGFQIVKKKENVFLFVKNLY